MEHDQIAERLRLALDQEVARHEVSPGAWPRIEQRLRSRARRWVVPAATAAVVAAVAVAVPYVRHASTGPVAATGQPRLVLTGRDQLPGKGTALVAGFGSIWVVGSNVVYRVDQATVRTVATIPAPGTGVPAGIAVGSGAVWVTSDHGGHVGVYRIDPVRDRVTAFIPLALDPVAVAAAGGRIWVAGESEPCVAVRIDPATNRTTGSPVTISASPVSIVSGAGSLWVTSGAGGSVDRIDPATGAVTAAWSVLNVDAVGAGSLWGTTGNGIQRLDPRTGALAVNFTLPGASYVTFWAGSAWAVVATPSGGLFRIDPSSNRVTGQVTTFGNDLTYVAPGSGALWVNDYSTGELLRYGLE